MATILSIIACALPFGGPDTSGTATSQAVTDIPYCDTDSTVLCLISFGVDNKGQMFINFYKPNLSVKDFYLKVRYDHMENMYQCETIRDFKRYISCTGERIPLEEQIEIGVYLTDDNALIAKGAFVISAFAIVTPVIVSATPTTLSSTSATAPTVIFLGTITPTRTKTPQFTPTRTLTPGTGTPPTPTRTPTKTSTPTVSYPNP